MKVLVTGCDGYIGLRLVQVLKERGHDVSGLDTGYFRSGWLFNGAAWLCPVISKDIRQVTAEDVRGFDAVIHLAEVSNDPVGQTNPEVTYSINRDGTKKLIDACLEAKVPRFVYFSSCSVYGESQDISTETSPLKPLTAYAECKVLNEQELLKHVSESFTPVILRNATAFGISPRMRFDLVINNLAGIAWTKKKIAMESDGTPWRPFVHIADISKAAACALEAPAEVVRGEIFNVGMNANNYQIRDVAEVIRGVFPDCEVSFGTRGGDKRDYRVNFDKINTKLPGFSCDYDVKRGALELKQVFEHIGMGQDIFDSRHYTRLKQISHLLGTKQINDKFFWTELPKSTAGTK
jgi:nucleoside-diphosphate-sugar epimerase